MGADAVIIYNQALKEDTDLHFLELLLDETLICGNVYVPLHCYQNAGTVNRRLPAKQVYEYVLRLACSFPVRLSKKAPENMEALVMFENRCNSCQEALLQTDCYVIARYKKILLERGLFDAAVESIIQSASQSGCRQRIISFLEEMLRGGDVYQHFYQGSQPFLIYKGNDECYQVLDAFAECIGDALRRAGNVVEFFDSAKEKHTALSHYAGKSFQGIVGIQTYLFSVRMEDGSFLHDKINGKKYNFVFDHPLWMYRQFQNIPDSLIILTLDLDYVAYIRKYYGRNAYFLPPGGIQRPFVQKKRIYDVVFIGSFLDNSIDIFQKLRKQGRPMRFLVNRLWLVMRKNPGLPVEAALRRALIDCGYQCEKFSELCYEMREYILYLSYYYRRKLIKTLVCSGIKVHVFGTSWKYCTFRDNPNFIWHNKDLDTQECLNVWQQSKIALNIMSCHKNAITERIANSMLQKAVVCTEQNPYLESQFRDGQDIIFYNMAHLHKLPKRIAGMLADEKRLEKIGENGCRKAQKLHTWDCRVQELLKIGDGNEYGN